jgi:hypothetical protein
MKENEMIRCLSSAEIDKSKWDACIDKSSNGLIYAYSLYLDHMSRNWDGLIYGDYEAVMPLTWNRKYGIYYLYQPFIAAQLGVFGNGLNTELLTRFLQAVPGKFKYWDIYLNPGNNLSPEGFQLYSRKNFVLSLSKPYTELSTGYRENITRNIKKAKQSGCRAKKDFDVEEIIELALHQMKTYSKRSGENVERFRALYQDLHKQAKAMTYGIFSPKQELLASAVFFFSHQRAYYVLVGNNTVGKNIGASPALIDAFIEDNANNNLILDFEGSDISSLASFYSGFGAKEENYPAIRLNRLPFFLKWLKK